MQVDSLMINGIQIAPYIHQLRNVSFLFICLGPQFEMASGETQEIGNRRFSIGQELA